MTLNNSKDPKDGSDELEEMQLKEEESYLPSIHVEEQKDEKCFILM
ncbi:14646_t:CDS:2, partial [Gigaspora margarita]